MDLPVLDPLFRVSGSKELFVLQTAVAFDPREKTNGVLDLDLALDFKAKKPWNDLKML